MNTYKEAGVDIKKGDEASKAAYDAAKSTFESRKGMIGEPVTADGGYAGLIDMGEFYLVQNDDGVGTKSLIAAKIGQYKTLGYDLLCMVADDAVCLGAEVVSVTNTMDVAKVDSKVTKELMDGLRDAANLQKIALTGGEIAEVPDLSKGLIWNATAVGVVRKDQVIDGSEIKKGDTLIALPSQGFRSNGLTLVRHVLDKAIGPNWHSRPFPEGDITWGEAVLTPSVIYHDSILQVIGRYGEEPIAKITGIVHVTGGGIPGNLPRILKKSNLGAAINLDSTKVPQVMQGVINLGKIDQEEATKTWNMGVAMILATPEPGKVNKLFADLGIESYNIGKITNKEGIQINHA